MKQGENRHYAPAPIVEAIIGMDFDDDGLTREKLLQVSESLASDYPDTEDFYHREKDEEDDDPPAGLFRKSMDGLRVVHLKPHRFAFSRLAPYSNWEELYSNATAAWQVFRKVFTSLEVHQYNVRYINRLTVPMGEQVEDYLRIYPKIPKELPQAVSSSYMRLDFPLKLPVVGRLIHQLFTVQNNSRDKVSLILDNDFTFESNGVSDSEMWSVIHDCRSLKNDFFNSALTDKMKGEIS